MTKQFLIGLNSSLFTAITGCYIYDHSFSTGSRSFLFGTYVDILLRYKWLCLPVVLLPIILLLPRVTRTWRICIVYSLIPLTVWYWIIINALSQ